MWKRKKSYSEFFMQEIGKQLIEKEISELKSYVIDAERNYIDAIIKQKQSIAEIQGENSLLKKCDGMSQNISYLKTHICSKIDELEKSIENDDTEQNLVLKLRGIKLLKKESEDHLSKQLQELILTQNIINKSILDTRILTYETKLKECIKATESLAEYNNADKKNSNELLNIKDRIDVNIRKITEEAEETKKNHQLI